MFIGGVYFGDGVNDNGDGIYDFNLVIVGVGIIMIIYIVGVNFVMDDVEVFVFLMVFFSVLVDICIDVGL